MSKYHSDTHAASDPGRVRLSRRRFRQLEPLAKGIRGFFWRRSKNGRLWQEVIDEHLQLGDSRAALVFSVEPLIVAAYTDELDSVVPLFFPSWLNRVHRLQLGTKLLTINTYQQGAALAPDLMRGEKAYPRFVNFRPLIADFYSEDHDRIAARKEQIDNDEWYRCAEMAQAYAKKFPGLVRSGTPLLSNTPLI